MAKTFQIFYSAGVPPLPSQEAERLTGLAHRLLSGYPISAGVNLVMTDDAYIRRLNATYRDEDHPTDVLSFDLSPARPLAAEAVGGEVYISLDRAREQAAERQIPLLEEIARLLIHGLLHLAGWVHHTSRQRKAMEDETDRFLKEAGFSARRSTGER